MTCCRSGADGVTPPGPYACWPGGRSTTRASPGWRRGRHRRTWPRRAHWNGPALSGRVTSAAGYRPPVAAASTTSFMGCCPVTLRGEESPLRRGEADDAVVVSLAAIDHRRPARVLVQEQIEVVADELHLEQRVVHGHRVGGMLLLADDPPRQRISVLECGSDGGLPLGDPLVLA